MLPSPMPSCPLRQSHDPTPCEHSPQGGSSTQVGKIMGARRYRYRPLSGRWQLQRDHKGAGSRGREAPTLNCKHPPRWGGWKTLLTARSPGYAERRSGGSLLTSTWSVLKTFQYTPYSGDRAAVRFLFPAVRWLQALATQGPLAELAGLKRSEIPVLSVPPASAPRRATLTAFPSSCTPLA